MRQEAFTKRELSNLEMQLIAKKMKGKKSRTSGNWTDAKIENGKLIVTYELEKELG